MRLERAENKGIRPEIRAGLDSLGKVVRATVLFHNPHWQIAARQQTYSFAHDMLGFSPLSAAAFSIFAAIHIYDLHILRSGKQPTQQQIDWKSQQVESLTKARLAFFREGIQPEHLSSIDKLARELVTDLSFKEGVESTSFKNSVALIRREQTAAEAEGSKELKRFLDACGIDYMDQLNHHQDRKVEL